MSEVTKNKINFFGDKSSLKNGIEFIGLINKHGKVENSLFKNDITLTKEKKEMFLMGLRLQFSMQSDYDSDFGPVSYTLTERGNSKFVSISTISHTVLAIMKKSLNHIKMVEKIKIALRDLENVPKIIVFNQKK